MLHVCLSVVTLATVFHQSPGHYWMNIYTFLVFDLKRHDSCELCNFKYIKSDSVITVETFR